MSGTEASVREGRSVGLSADEVLALEVELDLVRGAVELNHLVLNLAGKTVANAGGGHRLEPVAVGVGPVVHCRVERSERVRDVVYVAAETVVECRCVFKLKSTYPPSQGWWPRRCRRSAQSRWGR